MRIALLAAAVFSLTRVVEAAPVEVHRAADFIDSIGVCTHWNYADTPYGGSYERVRDLLVESGIRHYRDGLNHDRFADLAKRGLSSCIVAEPDLGTPIAIVAKVAALNEAQAGSIDAIEGTNEPDLFWPMHKKSYKGSGHEQSDEGIHRGVVMFQKDLFAAVNANPATRDLTVIGPALGKTYDPINPFFFKAGELTAHVDLGNFHPYAGGNPFSPPFAYAGIEKYIWHGTQPTAKLDEFPYAFDTFGQTFKPKPMATTECGYSTWSGGTSLEAHGRYMPRLFADHFRLGIRRSYSYEFVDEWNRPDDREANFGLVRHDLTPKPAYHAIKNMIALLDEPRVATATTRSTTAPAQPRRLDITMKVNPPPGYERVQYVRQLLLQKRDGEFCLLLWHDIALEDSSVTPFRQVRHPDMPVTLTLPATVADVKVYFPNDGVEPKSIKTKRGVLELSVPDRVMILTFSTARPAAR